MLCVDETSRIQALGREQPVLPGVSKQRTHNYIRDGTASLFAILDVASRFVIGKCYRLHRGTVFLSFLKEIGSRVPGHLDVHIITDNYAVDQSLAGKTPTLPGLPPAKVCVLDQSD